MSRSFGDGPRNCIGELNNLLNKKIKNNQMCMLIDFYIILGTRFGKMQTKVGIVKIMSNYTVDVCDKTDKNFIINPRGFLLTPKNPVYLKIKKSPIV